ncbi:MAG: proteasome assembly chaperone family protein [Candidatus Saliniplasma sp.]
MDDIVLKYKERPQLENAILIEGLPGVGNVGKLAAEHLIDEIDAELFCKIYSIYLPPQVLVSGDGIAKLVNNELYYKNDVGEENLDLVILTGDYQGMTPQGQYRLTDKLLSISNEFGIKKIFSLGGYGQGEMVETPDVLGAVTNEDLIENMEELGVVFSEEHPSSGIVGASGLLLGLGKSIYDIDGVCLMGETSGYFVDPGAARAVLKILVSYLGFEVSYDKLDDKAKEVESLTTKLKEMDTGAGMQQESGKEDLSYIG